MIFVFAPKFPLGKLPVTPESLYVTSRKYLEFCIAQLIVCDQCTAFLLHVLKWISAFAIWEGLTSFRSHIMPYTEVIHKIKS